MPIASMTAFARLSKSIYGLTLTCEIKSVNHRYCDVSIRTPDELRSLEMTVRELIKRQLQRGKVDVIFSLEKTSEESMSFKVDEVRIRGLLEASQHLVDSFGLAGQLTVPQLLSWPGVLREARCELAQDELEAQAWSLLEETVLELVRVREREGERIACILEDRLSAMQPLLIQVEKALPDIRARFEDKLQVKLQEVTSQIDPERMAQEVVYFLQRIDIAEELDRLQSHIVELQNMLTKGGVIGRQLDFMMQEFNREANTLASKSNNQVCTQAAVELKVLIEQMREQIQNIV